MDVIHEEGDFECNTGMDGKPVQLQSRCDVVSRTDLLLDEQQCVVLRIRVVVWMKADRVGQSCSSRVGR